MTDATTEQDRAIEVVRATVGLVEDGEVKTAGRRGENRIDVGARLLADPHQDRNA